MESLNQKVVYLKWLKSIGIEYYFSEKKDSNISSIRNLIAISNNLERKTKDKDKDKKKYSIDKVNHICPSINSDINLNSTIYNARILANTANSIEKLKSVIMDFIGCDLKNFSRNTVFADGNPEAEIMLVGEAPGVKEDESGIPFCGESGELLDKMLSTINLSRKKNVYITNTIFWRPPANRRPTKHEIEICLPFVEKHIALKKPKLIICIGSTAVAGLLGQKISINAAKSISHFYQNIYLSKPINTMAIYHPAYVLRQPSKKKDAWFDLIKIQQFLEEKILV